MVVTLHYIEFVPNGLGIWDHKWFATEEEAQKEYDRLIAEEEFDPELECGEEGCIAGPYSVDVALTLKGLLAFANNWAVDRGAC